MKFKIDENLPVDVAVLFRKHGYNAFTVLEQSLGGKSDPDIISACQREGRVLVSLDTDFADICSYPPAEYAGLIVLRLREQDLPHVSTIIERMLKAMPSEPLEGHLWIVEDDRIRIRE